VNGRLIRRKLLTEYDRAKLACAAEEMRKIPVYFAQSQSQTLLSVGALATNLSTKLAAMGQRLVLIVIDHIGLLKPSAKIEKRHEQVAESSRGLRYLAEQHGCHVMALAQIKRAAEERKGSDKMPKLYDLKESGSLEEDADNVILLHRERDDQGMFVKGVPAWCSVAKQRNDDLGIFRLKYDAPRFLDWDEP
jgi:replicative DNA helicase